MRGTVAKWVVAMGAGLALIVAQGCRNQAASVAVQPVVSTSRLQVQPHFPVGPLQDEEVDRVVTAKVDQTPLRQPQGQRLQVQPVQVQPDAGAVEQPQRRQDAMLLQQQEAAYERQQE